jgi:hypothetical protein
MTGNKAGSRQLSLVRQLLNSLLESPASTIFTTADRMFTHEIPNPVQRWRFSLLLGHRIRRHLHLPCCLPASHKKLAVELADEADPVVNAIWQLKKDKGRWPDDLATDLVPNYLPEIPALLQDRWLRYGLRHDEFGPILRLHSSMHCHIQYQFPQDEYGFLPPGIAAGWVLDDEGTYSYLPHRSAKEAAEK